MQESLREEFNEKTQVLTIWVGDTTFQTFPQLGESKTPWRWRARSTQNRRIVATSGEVFAKRGNAERAMRAFIDAVQIEK